MNIPSSSEEGGVDVRTVMSFTYSWLHKLGVTKTDEISEFENYEKQCEELKKYFDEGVLGQTDIKNVKEENSEQFHYDAILVDEAQDWPQGEADVLMRLYGEEKVSLADGMSQLIRGSRTNWKPTISDNLPEVKKAFHECLRMKKSWDIRKCSSRKSRFKLEYSTKLSGCWRKSYYIYQSIPSAARPSQ